MAQNYVQEGDVLNYTNASGSTITSGTAILIGTWLGVALADIANGATGSVAIEGVFTVAKLSTDVVAQGALLYPWAWIVVMRMTEAFEDGGWRQGRPAPSALVSYR